MARLRQQYPQNYGSSGNISTEFESIVRYLNSAEYGNNTVSELLAKLFDENGVWDGPVEFRKDSSAGFQYRIGEYSTANDGWKTLATLAELRGQDGKDFGEIGAPIIHTRSDSTATAGQTVVDYSHATTDNLLVFVNGLLKTPTTDYTTSATGGTGSAGAVTFTSGLSLNDTITIYKIRATTITGFKRTDFEPATGQSVFAFDHTAETKLQVYLNGVLQREGGSYDYTLQPDNNTVTYNNTTLGTNDTFTVITVENTTVQAVTGMMFEEDFADTSSGMIKFDKITIADGDIPQAKVATLATDIGNRPVMFESASAPTSSSTPVPAQGDLWLNTADDTLHFYSSQSTWVNATPESSLPSFNTTNANQFVKVNGTGTALSYSAVDLSSVIPVSQKGAASGVATLDTSARIPTGQLPTTVSAETVSIFQGSPADTTSGAVTYYMKSIFKQNVAVTHIRVITDSGSINVQLQANGVNIGSNNSATTTGLTETLSTPYALDATNAPIKLTAVTTGNTSASNLEVIVALTINS